MPTAKRNTVVEGTVKMSSENKEAYAEANETSVDKLNDLLKYKAIVPSEDSKPVKQLETAVEKVLNNCEGVLLKAVAKEDLPRLKNNVLESVKAGFLNKGCYSQTHLQSLIAKGKLKVPTSDKVTAETPDVVIEW